MPKPRTRYQLDQPEILQTLCYLVKGMKTPNELMKATGNNKGPISEKLNLLIKAHFVKAEDDEKDRRYKYFLPDYAGLQKAFVGLVKSRCEKRLAEVQKTGMTKEEAAIMDEPKKFLNNTYAVFDKFNQSAQGKKMFRKLFEIAINQKDFVSSIDDVFEGIITVYSNIVQFVPSNIDRPAKEQLEAVMACCIVARKLNLFVLEEAAREALKEKA